MRLFCFGFGYAAEALARRLSARTTALAGTRTRLADTPPPLGARLAAFQSDGATQDVRGLLSGTTHLLVSIPPDLEGDVVLRHFREDLGALPELDWVGYLSTVGVYGDCQGRWVDETSPVRARAIDAPLGHAIYNVADDEPAPPEDVVAYAADLLGLPVPPAVPFARAGLGDMAASFWAECKRVSNARIKTALGVALAYPTYREGLRALIASA